MERGVIDPIGLDFLREALVEPCVRLRLCWFSGVRQTIQEVGRCNRPPCRRNQLFSKSVHQALGVPNEVAVDLEELDVRDGCILKSRID